MPIHPLAVVDPQAEIHPDAIVGPFCMVRGKVTLEAGVELRNSCTVYGRSVIRSGTVVFPGAVVGADPQDLKFKGEDSVAIVGRNCRIHECATISRGTEYGGMETVVGDDCLIMAYAHVAHDCRLAERVVVANGAQLAGHCVIGRRCVISGLVAMHHFASVGELTIVGGMSGVANDLPPYVMADGTPAEPRNINVVGLRRDGWSDDRIHLLRDVFRDLYSGRGTTPIREALAEVQDEIKDKPDHPGRRLTDWLEQFLSNAKRGRVQESTRGQAQAAAPAAPA